MVNAVTTEALKYWLIALAGLVLALAFFVVTGGGSVGVDVGVGTLLTIIVVIIGAWRWGGWSRS